MKTSSQRALTSMFLSQVGREVNKHTIARYMREWWFNFRESRDNTFRLQSEGYRVMSEILRHKFWPVTLPEKFEQHPALMLFLNRHLKHPYYVEPNKLMITNLLVSIKLIMFIDDIKTVGVARAQSIFLSKKKVPKNKSPKAKATVDA